MKMKLLSSFYILLLPFINFSGIKINKNPPLNTIEYHLQEQTYYCGAACAQMVLKQMDVPHSQNTCTDDQLCSKEGNFNTLVCQRCLYEESHTPVQRYPNDPGELGWFSYPDALTMTLNNHLPAHRRQFQFKLFECDNTAIPEAASVITQKIIWTIHHHNVSPITLTSPTKGGNKHWIVVTGYDSPNHPLFGDDTSFDINSVKSFWVHNPYSPGSRSSSGPPPHFTGDKCGSGYDSTTNEDWGIANEMVSKTEWFESYMLPVYGGYWDNKYLSICDSGSLPQKGKKIVKEKPHFSGGGLITPATAEVQAKNVLSGIDFVKNNNLPKKLRTAKPGTPLFVNRIDKINQDYYIVPFVGDDGKTYAFVNIDAKTGLHKQSGFPTKNGYLPSKKILTKNEILNYYNVDSSLIPLARRGSVTVKWSSRIVWKPCQESMSPFYPFQEIKIKKETAYVRLDGKIFSQLSISEAIR